MRKTCQGLGRHPLIIIVAFMGLTGWGSLSADCLVDTDHLLQDREFAQITATGGVWLYSQHSGETSFTLRVEQGELEIKRVSDEPWMLLAQTVTDSSLSGSRVRFSADLKGDAPAVPPIHAFEHKAGLYLKAGNRRDVILADHTPNSGQWDWQAVSVEKDIPVGVDQLRVGFVHQSGGVLWVRNPRLMRIDCSASEE